MLRHHPNIDITCTSGFHVLSIPFTIIMEHSMPQYCDSAVLESNWFHWILSSRVQSLEQYRKAGLLWTKVIGTAKDKTNNEIEKDGKKLLDPSFSIRHHCIALHNPIFFDSNNGVVNSPNLPEVSTLTLDSIGLCHDLHDPLIQQTVVIPNLIANGYIKELPCSMSWKAMTTDMYNICRGIAVRFNQPNEDELLDLTNDAFVILCKKITERKLVYTPGVASVFNLLTTTIYRIMYSIMNRRTSTRNGLNKILKLAESGVLKVSVV